MSREAFEKWYAGYFGCEFGLNYHGDDDLERAWQAATELTAERDALRGVLEEISHDEGRFGLSASDMRELAKQVLARTALGGG